MKKKVIATVLAGSMLMMPFPVFADDDDNYLHTLRFDKIKTEMEARSPLISSMWEKVSDGSSKIDDGIDGFKLTREILMLRKPKNYIDGTTTSIGLIMNPVLLPDSGDISGAGDFKIIDSALVAYFEYQELLTFTQQIEQIDAQIKSLEDSDDDLWKSYVQVEEGKNQTIRGVQQMFLGYFTAEQGRDELKSNLDLLESQLKVAKLRESLGMETSISTLETESQIKELQLTLDSLNKSLESMLGNINIMLGQDFDTELTLEEPPEVTRSMLRDMDYEEDLEDALIQSYDVRLEEDSDDIKNAKRSFTLSFHQVYQNVLDKQKALELAQEKLTLEQKKYDQNYLMFSLGLMSSLDFDGIRSLYKTKTNAVETAERELLQAYTDYEWMKKGLTVSAGTGGSSAATSSSSTTSGMGF